MRVAAFLLALSACASPFTYGKQLGTPTCALLDECDPDGFAESWSSQEACVDDFEAVMDCLLDNCSTFNVDAAQACIQHAKSAECEDVPPSDCSEVWTECDAEALLCGF